MSWLLSTDRPIYTQLVEQIQVRIVTGFYPRGSKMPSVRDLAAEAAVNPNTMQRALTELENGGLLFSQRTSGRFITEDEVKIMDTKNQLAQTIVDEFISNMEKLGYTRQQTVDFVHNSMKEES